MNPSFHFISLNIEGQEHLDTVSAFLEQEQGDFIFLQEAVQEDADAWAKALGMQFTHTIIRKAEPQIGLAILSRYPITNTTVLPYGRFFNPDNAAEQPLEITRGIPDCLLLATEVASPSGSLMLGCTHFTWTPNGEPTEFQHYTMQNLLKVLENYPEILLCGDFNSARGKGVFEMLANKYKDNIPFDVMTTIDPTLHRAGPLQLVVDGVFSGPSYLVSDVEIVTGISDHCAIKGTIVIR